MLVHADDLESVEASNETSCLEEQLRSLGLLDNKDDLTSNSMLNSTKFKGISLEENMPPKKVCFFAEIEKRLLVVYFWFHVFVFSISVCLMTLSLYIFSIR